MATSMDINGAICGQQAPSGSWTAPTAQSEIKKARPEVIHCHCQEKTGVRGGHATALRCVEEADDSKEADVAEVGEDLAAS